MPRAGSPEQADGRDQQPRRDQRPRRHLGDQPRGETARRDEDGAGHGRELLGGDEQTRRRAGFAAVELAGLVFTRYILQFEPVASASVDEAVQILAPALRRVLEPTRTSPARRV